MAFLMKSHLVLPLCVLSCEHRTFAVQHDGQWHKYDLPLPTAEVLHGFRLDPCKGPGVVRLRGLTLLDGQGQVLQRWPE